MRTLQQTASARIIQTRDVIYTAIPAASTRRGHPGCEWWQVPCVECTAQYIVSRRTFREMVARGRVPRCTRCRLGPSVRITNSLRKWWLQRYSVEELIEIVEGIRGPRHQWPEVKVRKELERLAREVAV